MTDGLYRRIYAGYLKSRKINKLSLQAEAWFWRLHSIADDYGNLHGDPVLIWKDASGRRDITVKQAEALTQEILDAGLAYAYYSDDDVFIHIVGFESKQPAGRNGKRIQKHPMHPDSPPSLPGESGGIQNNPRESQSIRKILTHHSHSHSHSQDQDKDQDNSHIATPADAVAASVAKPRSEKQIERDGLFDALKAEFFPSGTSKADESLIGKTVTALIAKHARPEEVPVRRARWPTLYPDAGPLTPPGLAKHWDALGIVKETKPFEFVAPEAW